MNGEIHRERDSSFYESLVFFLSPFLNHTSPLEKVPPYVAQCNAIEKKSHQKCNFERKNLQSVSKI